MKKRFIFLNSHPIQYFAPMYTLMAKDESVDVKVLYCSRKGVEQAFDHQFNRDLSWNIPLLEGYDYFFLKNYAPKSLSKGFWSLQNWGLIKFLWKAPKSVLVVNGWQYAIFVAAVFFGKLFGHTVCFRIDTPLGQELKRPSRSLSLRKVLLGKVLFRFVDYFLYIGRQNKAFYQFYGIPERRLISSPFSVDNQRFCASLPSGNEEKKQIRRSLQLPENDVIILYSGKYIAHKRPFDLLQAFLQSGVQHCTLVMLGEGEERDAMEEFIRKNRLDKVILTGFVNQAEIPRYYAAANIFVMPSDYEPWGLSVNEAMNLRLPVILSDAVGCADDLVVNGENGFVYPVGDTTVLAEKIKALSLDPQFCESAGQRSFEIIENYSFKKVIQNLKNLPAS